MASSSGGSITLRLGVAGSDEVKAALASLGPAGASALRQIEQAQAGPTAGMKALNAAGQDVTAGMQDFAGKAGIAGSALTAIGPAGLAAAAGIGAVIAIGAKLVDLTRQAMAYGESIEISAKAAGVSTTALQTWRYAADQAGVAIGQTDSALKAFTERLGEGEIGSPRSLKWFQELFGPDAQDVLKAFPSVDAAIDATIAKLAEMGNVAEREALAKHLGLGDLIPLIDEGIGRISELTAEAANMGHVLDEQTVKSLADSEKQFKSLSDVISVQLKEAVVDITPLILGLVQSLADAARAAADFMGQFQTAENRSDQVLRDQIDVLKQAQSQTPGQRLGMQFLGAIGAANGELGLSPQEAYAKAAQLTGALAQHAKENAASNTNNPPTDLFNAFAPKGRKPKGPTPDEIAKNSASLDDQGGGDIAKAEKDELTAQLALTSDVQQRADIQAQIAAMDNASAAAASQRRLDEAKLQLQQGKITKAAYDKFVTDEATARSSEQIAEAAKAELANRTALASTLEQQNALEKQDLQNKADALKAQLALTTDLGRRRDLSLEIYDVEYEIKKNDLLIQLATDIMAKNTQGAALVQKQLNDLAAGYAPGRQGVSNSNPANAFDAWVQKQKQDLPTLTQEWAQLKTDGIDAFNQSLFDSEGKLNNLGQIAHSVFAKMLVDLEQYLLKQAEVGLFGGGSAGGAAPGGGGFLSSILGVFGLGGGGGAASGAGVLDQSGFGANIASLVAGFADGGLIQGSGGPRSDSNLAWVSTGEYVMNAAATQHWLPVLNAMNDTPAKIPHFAGGGMVGGGSSGGGGSMGGTYVDNRRVELNAPGADPAALQRLHAEFQDWRRNEPNRVAGYMVAAKVVRGK